MYEHVRGNLDHKHNLEINKKETYLPLFKLIQLKKYSKLLNYEVFKDEIFDSEIRYSTIRYNTHIWVLNFRYSTQYKATMHK